MRAELLDLAGPQQRLDEQDALRVLIIGGSQGALVLNEVVPAAVALVEAEQALEIWHQSGAATLEVAVDAYSRHGVDARIDAFVDGGTAPGGQGK